MSIVVNRLLTPSAEEDGRLAEDDPSTVKVDPSLPMESLDLSRVAENTVLLSVLAVRANTWMEVALMDLDGGNDG